MLYVDLSPGLAVGGPTVIIETTAIEYSNLSIWFQSSILDRPTVLIGLDRPTVLRAQILAELSLFCFQKDV